MTSDVVAPGKLSLVICDEHKESSTLEDFMTDEGWQKLINQFAEQGLARPKRSRTTLGWVTAVYIGDA